MTTGLVLFVRLSVLLGHCGCCREESSTLVSTAEHGEVKVGQASKAVNFKDIIEMESTTHSFNIAILGLTSIPWLHHTIHAFQSHRSSRYSNSSKLIRTRPNPISVSTAQRQPAQSFPGS